MKTRVDIISGFLGAGKTTLILELLKAPPEGQTLAICENEYGEVGIDGEAFEGSGLEVVEINAGCVCCTLSFNLIAGIKLLVARLHPDRIVLEPTGLAGLADVLNILRDDNLTPYIDIGKPAVVLDGTAFLKNYDRFERFHQNQIGSAEVVFLNRTEGLDAEALARLTSLLEGIRPGIAIAAAPWNPAELWAALDAPFSATPSTIPALPAQWLKQFDQTSVPTGWPGSRERLERWIAGDADLGEVLRAKGTVMDRQGARWRVGLSGGRWAFEPAGEGGTDRLQLIGFRLSAGRLKRFFDSNPSPHAPPP